MNFKSLKYFLDNLNLFQVSIIILAFSLLYSLFINPHSQENITLAYILFKNFNIDYFSWSSATSADPTVQILFPYLLFKLGIDKIIIHHLWQTLTVFISVFSFFYLSKIITKSNFYSILIILILLNHRFINTNLYGIYFPSHFYYLGQVGMYLVLLSYCFFINKKTSISIVIMLINFFFMLVGVFLIYV